MNLKGCFRRAFYPALMLAQSRDSTAAFQPIRRAIHQMQGPEPPGKYQAGTVCIIMQIICIFVA